MPTEVYDGALFFHCVGGRGRCCSRRRGSRRARFPKRDLRRSPKILGLSTVKSFVGYS